MNFFDAGIISLLNGFAHRSWSFDTFIALIGLNHLIKGGVITALIWWTWFRQGNGKTETREILFFGIAACFLALAVARTLSCTFPFRERPLRNPALHFQIPYGMDERVLIGWSSFPSDHAAVFFALATSIFFVSRRAGILALCHALFVVNLTRVYLGIHYPTDILAGALIGIGIASLSKISTVKGAITRPGMRWLQSHPSSFYAFLFLVTFQLSITFEPLRDIGRFVFVVAKAILNLL